MKKYEDAGLFRKMSEPHESKDSIETEMNAFYDEIRASREKHKIKNVAIVTEVSFLSDGKESSAYAVSTIGDTSAAEGMFAFGYGTMKQEREKFIGDLLKGK